MDKREEKKFKNKIIRRKTSKADESNAKRHETPTSCYS